MVAVSPALKLTGSRAEASAMNSALQTPSAATGLARLLVKIGQASANQVS